jgi:hypothetical protein
MAKNRIASRSVALAVLNTWYQVPLVQSGKEGHVRTVYGTNSLATIEIALSVAAPAGAGTVLPVVEASRYSIQNAATHTLWVRATNAAAVGAFVEVDPSVNGNVLTVTA